MSPNKDPVRDPVNTTVEIFGRHYTLRSAESAEHLQQLAAWVDGKMREIERLTATADSLKIAVLAALNIADELSQLKSEHGTLQREWSQREQRLLALMDQVVGDEKVDESPA